MNKKISLRGSNTIPRAARLVLLALVITAVAACSGGGGGDSEDDGNGPSTDACSDIGLKVIDGTTCRTEDSAIVELTIFEFDGSASICTGTLIDQNHVLTAGHCFLNRGASTAEVDVRFGTTSVTASDFNVHPGYREDDEQAAVFNDVAIVTVTPPGGVSPVPLFLSRTPAVGDIFDIFGYGLDEGGALGTLKSGQMEIDLVSTNHITSIFDGEGSNTCQGDSGGPAIEIVNGGPALIGITSSGSAEAACQVGDVSLFVNIQDPSVLDFITSQAPNTGGI